MAGKLKSQGWDEYDAERMRLAVEEIRGSENLRYFFRRLLSDISPFQPMGGEPHQVQMQAGRHSASLDIINNLEAHDPMLPILLQHEGVEEHFIRNSGDKDVPDS